MIQAAFYRHFAVDPYYNMAFDEWMFARACALPGSVFLRLYSWNQGAVTFGYNQRQGKAIDFSKLAGTPAIRRITGGRALYHDPSELTYSVAVNTCRPAITKLAGSVSQTAAAIAQMLVGFLARLGIESEYARCSTGESAGPGFFHKAPCFASSAKHEIVSGSGKIIASAQRRMGTTFLQHGSIKIGGVSRHPSVSISMDDSASEDKPPPLQKTQFDRMARLFLDEFVVFSGFSVAGKPLCQRSRKEVIERASYVQKKCLVRRVIFKQRVSTNSLLGSR